MDTMCQLGAIIHNQSQNKPDTRAAILHCSHHLELKSAQYWSDSEAQYWDATHISSWFLCELGLAVNEKIWVISNVSEICKHEKGRLCALYGRCYKATLDN